MSIVRAAAFGVMWCLGIPIAAMASAEEPVALPQSQAAAKSAYQNQLICKMKTAVGSHIPKRICKTQAQIDAERESAQRALATCKHHIRSAAAKGRDRTVEPFGKRSTRADVLDYRCASSAPSLGGHMNAHTPRASA